MWAALDWGDLSHAGAFLVGAVLASVACLRIMRAVITVFDGTGRRRWGRRPPPDDRHEL